MGNLSSLPSFLTRRTEDGFDKRTGLLKDVFDELITQSEAQGRRSQKVWIIIVDATVIRRVACPMIIATEKVVQ